MIGGCKFANESFKFKSSTISHQKDIEKVHLHGKQITYKAKH